MKQFPIHITQLNQTLSSTPSHSQIEGTFNLLYANTSFMDLIRTGSPAYISTSSIPDPEVIQELVDDIANQLISPDEDIRKIAKILMNWKES